MTRALPKSFVAPGPTGEMAVHIHHDDHDALVHDPEAYADAVHELAQKHGLQLPVPEWLRKRRAQMKTGQS